MRDVHYIFNVNVQTAKWRPWRYGLLVVGLVLLSACNLVREVDTTPGISLPTIEFLAPASNITVADGEVVLVQLLARDERGSGVARIVLRADDVVLNDAGPVEQAAVPIFAVDMNWLARGAGRHVLSATAYRGDGAASVPAAISIIVEGVNQPTPTRLPLPGA